MKLVTLREFRKLVGISDAGLISLLEANILSCQLDPSKGIMIDTDSVTAKEIARAAASQRKELFEDELPLLIEKCTKILREELDTIVDRAILKFRRKTGI